MNIKFLLKPKSLDLVTEKALSELDSRTPGTPEYTAALQNVAQLMEIKRQNASRRITYDALLAAAVNLGGILLVINYERIHIITSKSFGMVKTK